MRVSLRMDYAVRAMAELAADRSERPVKAERIATAQDIPLKYLLDIFLELKRDRLVRSTRGPDGGFMLSRPASQISIADVFRAVDGPLADVHDESLRDLRYPTAAAELPVVWMAMRASLRRVFEKVTLEQLATGRLPKSVRDLAAEYQRATGSERPAR